MQDENKINETFQSNDLVQYHEQTDVSSPPESSSAAQKKLPSKKVLIAVFVGLMIAGIFFFSTTPITESQKDERIIQAYLEEGYDAAMNLVRRYYGDSDNAVAWAMIFSEQEDSAIKDLIDITDHNLSTTSSGNYFEYTATLKNNSDKTLSYIELTIYLLDSEKNIIYSDWTNWSGTLPPGASTTLDTMLNYIDGVQYYKASVEDISIK